MEVRLCLNGTLSAKQMKKMEYKAVVWSHASTWDEMFDGKGLAVPVGGA